MSNCVRSLKKFTRKCRSNKFSIVKSSYCKFRYTRIISKEYFKGFKETLTKCGKYSEFSIKRFSSTGIELVSRRKSFFTYILRIRKIQNPVLSGHQSEKNIFEYLRKSFQIQTKRLQLNTLFKTKYE